MIKDIPQELLKAFTEEGHYYTSYPSLNHWTEDFKHPQYMRALSSFIGANKPLHLYLHIPFCAKLCFYCICNIVISNDRAKIQHFLDQMLKEIDLLHWAYPYPNIKEIQFGGGTPSHLDQKQFKQLCDKLNELVDLKSLDEVAMEIDPRTVTQDDLRHYASLGVTRISFGIQDFDPEVQKAINRVQPPEMIDALLTDTRSLFRGVNFDLLYGLPLQSLDTIQKTIDKVLQFKPDRITLLKYCHAPDVRRHMKLIKESDLPQNLSEMFVHIVQTLLDAGYVWVGLDHFALPSDSLAVAVSRGTVGRTFNGFTPGRVRDMIGIGPTTTGAFGRTYCQAQYELTEYYRSIAKGEFPILRGYTLSDEDLARREVIFSLMCNQFADPDPTFFEKELNTLSRMPQLVKIERGHVTVTEHGRVLLRNICKVFDNKDVRPEHHKIAQKSIVRRVA